MSAITIEGSSKQYLLLILSLGLFIALLGFSFAAINSNTVTTNSTNTATVGQGASNASTFIINEDTTYTYILAINNTAAAASNNITAVNVTMPTGFLFIRTMNNNGTNDTYYVYTEMGDTTVNDTAQFSNFTSVLTWNNTATALIRNATRRFFLFNATASNPGTYNLSIQLFNNNATSNGTAGIGNSFKALTIVVNDTTAPDTVTFASNSDATRVNNTNFVFVNFTFSDNGAFRSVAIRLSNNTANYTTVNFSVTTTNASSYAINFTGLADGFYYVNATVNDTFNNMNSTNNGTTSATRNISVDTTAPSVSLSCTPDPVDQGDTITCTCTATDAISGVKTKSYTINPSTANTGPQTTSCTVTDYSGNSRVSEVTYTVSSVGTGSGSTGGSSGGGSGGETSWTATYAFTDLELEQKGALTKELGTTSRMTVLIAGETHSVGVVSMTATSAEIEVASTPQRATMNVGETKKFDVNADGFYDMKVTLESIANSKAVLVVEYLNEEVPAEETTTETTGGTTGGAGTGGASGTASKTSKMVWIIVAIVVVVVIVLFFWMKRRK